MAEKSPLRARERNFKKNPDARGAPKNMINLVFYHSLRRCPLSSRQAQSIQSSNLERNCTTISMFAAVTHICGCKHGQDQVFRVNSVSHACFTSIVDCRYKSGYPHVTPENSTEHWNPGNYSLFWHILTHTRPKTLCSIQILLQPCLLLLPQGLGVLVMARKLAGHVPSGGKTNSFRTQNYPIWMGVPWGGDGGPKETLDMARNDTKCVSISAHHRHHFPPWDRAPETESRQRDLWNSQGAPHTAAAHRLCSTFQDSPRLVWRVPASRGRWALARQRRWLIF